MKIVITIIIAIVLMIITLYSFIYAIYKKVFNRTKTNKKSFKIMYTKKQEKNKNEIKNEIYEYYKNNNEDIYIESHDNLKLHAKYFHINDKNPIVISFHGYKGNVNEDHMGIKKIVADNDYNLLLVDHRAHGLSEGKTITYGIKERYDAKQWVNYISKRFPNNKIILAGSSLGATTVLMSSDLDLHENVAGIIAESPFSNPEELLNDMIKKKKYPERLMKKIVFLAAKIFGQFDLKSHTAIKSVKKTNIPILLFHGKNDQVVSYKMSEKLYENSKDKIEYHLLENSDHCLGFYENPDEYINITMKFIKKVLK